MSNRESAVTLAPGLTYRRFAQAAVDAAGYKNPVAEVDELYDKQLPSEAEYAEEVQKFEPYYYEGMRVAKYLQIIETEAGTDPEKYLELYDAGRTEQGRRDHGGTAYEEAIKLIPAGREQSVGEQRGIPEYQPGSKDAYFKRYVDVPDMIHEMVYIKASLMAAHRLLEQGGRQPVRNLKGAVDDMSERRSRSPDSYFYDAYGLIVD